MPSIGDNARPTTNVNSEAHGERVEVAWLGTRPGWLDEQVEAGRLDGLAVSSVVTPDTRVVHIARGALRQLPADESVDKAVPLVVDLGSVRADSHEELHRALDADAVLVESESDVPLALSMLPELDGRLAVCPTPLDLEFHAPEQALERIRGAYVKRFRRLHRLAHPTVLFVGPYTRLGGLDIAIEAAYRLRESFEQLRLAAVPLGDVVPAYLDECEMKALALGHRGIIEWACPPEERRFWYATATVVCCPWRGPAAHTEAPVMAAAAGRPFVGSDISLFRQSFRAPGSPELVSPGSVDELVATLEPLIGNVDAAHEAGTAARIAVESRFSQHAAMSRLTSVWRQLAALERPARAA